VREQGRELIEKGDDGVKGKFGEPRVYPLGCRLKSSACGEACGCVAT
jgi:hypothetical protein